MLYLSELLGKAIINDKNKKIGKLTDLVFVTSDAPFITKLQVKNAKQTSLYPVSCIKDINGSITIRETQGVPLAENEAYMAQNLLDQQIIDIKGKNIVRVNDVFILEKPQLIISGIDIGITGILRWFHLNKTLNNFLPKPLPDVVLPWSEIQPLELTRGKVVLNEEEDKLKSIAPEDLADYLEKTSIHNAMKILELVNDETASEVIQNLNISYQTQIFRHMSIDSAVKIITHADPDEAVDLLLLVSDEKKEHILSLLSKEKQKEIEFLLKHAETDIGELMTTEYLAFAPDETVISVLKRIKRETREIATLPYGYVVNRKNELIGAFSLHELLLQNDGTQLMKFMSQNVAVIHTSTPKTIAIKRMLKYKLRALPVIDEHRNILGIVTLDDVIEPILEKL